MVRSKRNESVHYTYGKPLWPTSLPSFDTGTGLVDYVVNSVVNILKIGVLSIQEHTRDSWFRIKLNPLGSQFTLVTPGDCSNQAGLGLVLKKEVWFRDAKGRILHSLKFSIASIHFVLFAKHRLVKRRSLSWDSHKKLPTWLSKVNVPRGGDGKGNRIRNAFESIFRRFFQNAEVPMECVFSAVQLLSGVWLFATPWTAARQASLSITNSRSPPKPMSIESALPSNHLICSHFLLTLPSIFPASGSFPMSQLFASRGQNIRVSALTWVLSINIQDWSPLRWTGWMSCSPRDSQESPPTPQFKSTSSSVLSFLYSPTLTSIHDHWKNHSLD